MRYLDGIEWVSAEWVKAPGILVLGVLPKMMILVGVWTIPGLSSPGMTMSGCWTILGWTAMRAMSPMSLPEQLVGAKVGSTMIGWS